MATDADLDVLSEDIEDSEDDQDSRGEQEDDYSSDVEASVPDIAPEPDADADTATTEQASEVQHIIQHSLEQLLKKKKLPKKLLEEYKPVLPFFDFLGLQHGIEALPEEQPSEEQFEAVKNRANRPRASPPPAPTPEQDAAKAALEEEAAQLKHYSYSHDAVNRHYGSIYQEMVLAVMPPIADGAPRLPETGMEICGLRIKANSPARNHVEFMQQVSNTTIDWLLGCHGLKVPDDPNDKLDLCVQIYFVLPEPAPFIAQPEPIGVRVINYSGNKFKLNMLTRKRKQTHHMIEYIACGVPVTSAASPVGSQDNPLRLYMFTSPDVAEVRKHNKRAEGVSARSPSDASHAASGAAGTSGSGAAAPSLGAWGQAPPVRTSPRLSRQQPLNPDPAPGHSPANLLPSPGDLPSSQDLAAALSPGFLAGLTSLPSSAPPSSKPAALAPGGLRSPSPPQLATLLQPGIGTPRLTRGTPRATPPSSDTLRLPAPPMTRSKTPHKKT